MLTHMLGLVHADDRHAGTLRADSHAESEAVRVNFELRLILT